MKHIFVLFPDTLVYTTSTSLVLSTGDMFAKDKTEYLIIEKNFDVRLGKEIMFYNLEKKIINL